MTRQEKKNILRKYPRICKQIEVLKSRIEETRTAGEKITQSFSVGGGSSGNESKVERAAVKIPELEERLQKRIRQKEKIENGLKGLRSHQRELIEKIYFEGVSQNRMAQILHKTPNSLRITVNRAVDEIIL